MKDKQQLIDSHKRLIESEAAKYAQFVPLSVVQSEAYKIANKAAESYDPKTGLQFSTHLTSQLKKLSRISTKYGTSTRVPENKQFQIQKVNQAELVLKDEYGRDPTINEIAHYTGFSTTVVANLLKVRKKEVNINNLAYMPTFVDNDNDDWVNFVYHDLTERDKFIFEHKTGFGGKPEMHNDKIAEKLNISPSTVNNRVKLITEKLQEGWRDDH